MRVPRARIVLPLVFPFTFSLSHFPLCGTDSLLFTMFTRDIARRSLPFVCTNKKSEYECCCCAAATPSIKSNIKSPDSKKSKDEWTFIYGDGASERISSFVFITFLWLFTTHIHSLSLSSCTQRRGLFVYFIHWLLFHWSLNPKWKWKVSPMRVGLCIANAIVSFIVIRVNHVVRFDIRNCTRGRINSTNSLFWLN